MKASESHTSLNLVRGFSVNKSRTRTFKQVFEVEKSGSLTSKYQDFKAQQENRNTNNKMIATVTSSYGNQFLLRKQLDKLAARNRMETEEPNPLSIIIGQSLARKHVEVDAAQSTDLDRISNYLPSDYKPITVSYTHLTLPTKRIV